MAAVGTSPMLFHNLSTKITQLLYVRNKNDRKSISKTLDDLNNINYKYPVVTNGTKAVLFINQICTLIPPEDSELAVKCCQLITNLVTKQNVVVEGRTLTIAVQWCLQALKEDKLDADILVALEALLCKNSNHQLFVDVVKTAPILNLARGETEPEIAFLALQCLAACTYSPDDVKGTDSAKFKSQFQICYDLFLSYLLKHNTTIHNKLINIKILTVCLRGLHNIIIQEPDFLQDNLGIILGVTKVYMLYKIKGIDFITPQRLMPSTLSIPEPQTNMIREKKGGKMTKQRKHRNQSTLSKLEKTNEWTHSNNVNYTPAVSFINQTDEAAGSSNGRLKTSDSDFSDTEGGNAAKISITAGRVRQAALNLFQNIVKLTEKNVMFSYWSSFIPDGPMAGKHNLLTCILKDTSMRGRMAALNALLALLTSSKLYLAQAEKGNNLSFTPFSVIIGLMIMELHKSLHLALNENSIPVLAQVLKCWAALVQATPYHRLPAGLISKLVRNVKSFVYHKDSTVQVTALIVFGCILASEPCIPETKCAFTKQIVVKKDELVTATVPTDNDSFEYAEFASDDEDIVPENHTEIPWLLERCLFNLGVKSDGTVDVTISTAVKLESLQILSAMSRNYFEEMQAPYLGIITKALNAALLDKYPDVRLHAGRAVDFIGQAMNRHNVQMFPFWQVLLNESLPSLLQSEEHAILRAVGCDCLGSIGSFAFEQLSREKQILCITLLFTCSRDEEKNVKGAAVRALAISVLYPSLRDYPGFVQDTAEAVLRVLQDENVQVKIKASWSLANLSEALVINNANPNRIEELPTNSLFKLLKVTVAASKDNDKIRMNTVRALGNLLQLISESLIIEAKFLQVLEEAIEILVKNCITGSNMKVRWNSCYAIGNAMKNSALFSTTINWQGKVFNALTSLVVNFRNFKVRINAAVALTCPKRREFYGEFYPQIWSALLKALVTSQHMDDFNEYKHRDNLVEQICLSLGHLITLMTKEDLVCLKDCIHSDTLQIQMQRVWERLVPEKSTILFDAHSYILKLNDGMLSNDQRNTISYLDEVLRPCKEGSENK